MITTPLHTTPLHTTPLTEPVTVLLSAQEKTTFLLSGGFWSNLFIAGSVVMILLSVLGAFGTAGEPGGGVLSLFWRIPMGLIGWAVLWVILFFVGSFLGMAAQSFANRGTGESLTGVEVDMCVEFDLPCDEIEPYPPAPQDAGNQPAPTPGQGW